MTIETARGPIDASKLGVTLMHEHLAITSEGVATTFPRTFDRPEAIKTAVSMLKAAQALGVDSIVDVTVMGIGRDIELIREVAAQVDINVIVATGMYTFSDVPDYFKRRSVDDMAQVFTDDITIGIGSTPVKAAILKCATDMQGVTPGVEMVLRACARTHRATGRPITTHTHAATERGLDQISIFEDEGVDLTGVIIGHCGDSNDIGYLEKIAAKGCVLGMDRFGVGNATNPHDSRVATLVEMCKRGWARQMVLSHDCPCTIDWFPSHPMGPARNITLVSEHVLPALRDAGVSDEDVDEMMVHTPRRLLTGAN